MGGCTNCRGKAGCDDRKGSMFEVIHAELARLYPSGVWGQPDDDARFEGGVCRHDGEAIAEELATELDAATFFRPGDDDELCDYIYVLCVGRVPCLVQARDFAVPLADVGPAGVDELYLRVCLSDVARVAGVQQTAMSLRRDGDRLRIDERPRPGVYDAPLLPRMQRLVALLPAYGITHLDFGEISSPPPGFDPGDYAYRYGGAPHTANYFFYPQPSTTVVTTLLDRAAAPG